MKQAVSDASRVSVQLTRELIAVTSPAEVEDFDALVQIQGLPPGVGSSSIPFGSEIITEAASIALQLLPLVTEIVDDFLKALVKVSGTAIKDHVLKKLGDKIAGGSTAKPIATSDREPERTIALSPDQLKSAVATLVKKAKARGVAPDTAELLGLLITNKLLMPDR